MYYVLIIFVLLGLFLNKDTSDSMTNVPAVLTITEGIVVMCLAKIMINKLLIGCSINYKSRLYNFFLFGFGVSLFYLNIIWIPYMIEQGAYSFDAIRYYYAIKDLTLTGETNSMMNYFGVIYFFTFFMKILGLSPLVPLFVNSLAALYAVICLSNFFSNNQANRYFPFLLLIPEVILFNSMSSREIICMAGITIFVLKAYSTINEFKIVDLIVMLASLLCVVFVRPPYGLMAIMCVGVYFMLQSNNRILSFVFIAIFCILYYQVTNFTEGLGDSFEAMEVQMDIDEEREGFEEGTYSANSISLLLMPSNSFEFIVFGIIRSFAYIILQSGNVSNPINSFIFNEVRMGLWIAWTNLFMFIGIPRLVRNVMRYSTYSNRYRIMIVSLVVCFFVVGSFVMTIHLRYRIVYDLLYFAVVLWQPEREHVKGIER